MPVKRTSSLKRVVDNKKEYVEKMPIFFKGSKDEIDEVMKSHPKLCGELKKSIFKFLVEVEKTAEKQGVPLGFDITFVLTGGVENGK